MRKYVIKIMNKIAIINLILFALLLIGAFVSTLQVREWILLIESFVPRNLIFYIGG